MGSFGGSPLPALDINPIGFGQENNALQLKNEAMQQDIQQQRSLAPYALKAAQQKSDLDTQTYGDSILAQIAKQAQAAEPDEAQSIWDQGMKDAAAKGVTAASQYVGHYRPDLAERIGEIYGGQQPTTPPGFDGNQVVQSLRAATPEVRQAALKNWTAVVSGFDRVRNESDWNNEVQTLRQMGMPVENFLNPSANWQMNYAMVKPYVDRLRASLPYAQQAVMADASGMPQVTAPVKLTAGESLVDPATGRVLTTAPTGSPFKYVTNPTTGEANILNQNTGELQPATSMPSVGAAGDPFMGFAQKMDQIENATGNPTAKNPLSSAQGNGQFIRATWLQEARKYIPQTRNMTDQQVLALRDDPQASQLVTAIYARENAASLMNAGMPVTTGTLALAHRLGPDGALKVLQSPADTPLAQILPANVIAANPDMKGQTAGSYAKGIISQIGNALVLTAQGTNASIPGDSKLHGDAYLKSIPDQALASDLRAYAQGRIQQPSSFFMKTPYGQMIMRALAQYDPGFDLTLYNSRVAANTDLAKGKMGQSITSFNQAIGHLGNLQDAVTRLENTNFPLINSAVNAWRNQTGDPRVTAFNVARSAVADELTRAFRGTGGNESDIASWEKNLNAANSPEQLHAAIQMAVHLLDSRIQAIGQQYNRAMRFNAVSDPTTLLSPNARATLARLGGNGGAAPKAPAVGTVQKGYRFNGGNPADPNSWVKVQ